ncbi:hypothetical protein GCM10020220_005860 [Nonomuraea rubra]
MGGRLDRAASREAVAGDPAPNSPRWWQARNEGDVTPAPSASARAAGKRGAPPQDRTGEVSAKGTGLSLYSQADLDALATRLNNRPRKCLGYRTPAQCVALTPETGRCLSTN